MGLASVDFLVGISSTIPCSIKAFQRNNHPSVTPVTHNLDGNNFILLHSPEKHKFKSLLHRYYLRGSSTSEFFIYVVMLFIIFLAPITANFCFFINTVVYIIFNFMLRLPFIIGCINYGEPIRVYKKKTITTVIVARY